MVLKKTQMHSHRGQEDQRDKRILCVVSAFLDNLYEHRQHVRSVVNSWKESKGCSACGFMGKHYQLDLDHIDPATKFGKQNHRAYEPNWKLDRVWNEIAKCQILCANCHREKTFTNSDHLPVCDSPAHDENDN